jgi:hypothetical protein
LVTNRAESKLTADPEAGRTAALAAQVVEGLDADPELRSELRHGDDGSHRTCYLRDNEPRTMGLSPELIEQLARQIAERGLGRDGLLFATRDGTPVSRNTFPPEAPDLPIGGARVLLLRGSG